MPKGVRFDVTLALVALFAISMVVFANDLWGWFWILLGSRASGYNGETVSGIELVIGRLAPGVTSFLTSIATVTTILIAWRQERRHAAQERRQAEQDRLRIAQLEIELANIRKQIDTDP